MIDAKLLYLWKVLEHGQIVFEAGKKRAFHVFDGYGAHVSSSFLEPRIYQRPSRGIALAEQRRHCGIGERRGARLWESEHGAG